MKISTKNFKLRFRFSKNTHDFGTVKSESQSETLKNHAKNFDDGTIAGESYLFNKNVQTMVFPVLKMCFFSGSKNGTTGFGGTTGWYPFSFGGTFGGTSKMVPPQNRYHGRKTKKSMFSTHGSSK